MLALFGAMKVEVKVKEFARYRSYVRSISFDACTERLRKGFQNKIDAENYTPCTVECNTHITMTQAWNMVR